MYLTHQLSYLVCISFLFLSVNFSQELQLYAMSANCYPHISQVFLCIVGRYLNYESDLVLVAKPF